MAYVSPNSTVKILTKVNLDSDYNHTFYFANVSAQTSYFQSKVKATSGGVSYTLNNYTYQRVNSNTIRVEILADNLYDCNYMMFQNTAFGNKWFYAFISKVNYINNSVSEIEYAIDVMQTWYFDYELGDCFVEREHSTTDVAGDNLVPEPFNVGDFVVSNTLNVDTEGNCGGVYLVNNIIFDDNQQLGKYIHFRLSGGGATFEYYYKVHDKAFYGLNDNICNVVNGLYLVTGLMISDDDFADFTGSTFSSYALVDPRARDSSGNILSDGKPYLTLGKLLQYIANGLILINNNLTPTTTSESDIAYAYQYPKAFSKISYKDIAEGEGYGKGTASKVVSLPSGFIRNYFRSCNNVESNYTSVKNKKMFTSQFMKLQVCNNQGDSGEYSIEDFSDRSNVRFKWVGCINANPTWSMFPYKYKGNYNRTGDTDMEEVDWDNGEMISNYPEPSYKGNNLTEYLRNNKASIGYGLITDALEASVSSFRGIRFTPKTKKITFKSQRTIAKELESLADSVGGTIAGIMDVARKAPNNYGQYASPNINTATKRMHFRINLLSIKPQFAKIIDDYMNMFGYQTNKVKIPNVKNSDVTLRPYWNFIKTNGCIIHPASDSGLPADDESDIASIYDKGITFWNKVNNDFPVGDYHFDNSPVEP